MLSASVSKWTPLSALSYIRHRFEKQSLVPILQKSDLCPYDRQPEKRRHIESDIEGISLRHSVICEKTDKLDLRLQLKTKSRLHSLKLPKTRDRT
ncbi:MAG: hypothetical protein EZS28_046883, partial [Streblomastix strix]